MAGSVDAAALRAAGWQLRGTLGALPYDDLIDADAYVDPQDVLDDPRLDAIAVDGADPSVVPFLPALRGDGLGLLLTGPAPLDVRLLVQLHEDEAPALVALARRWEPWLVTVQAAVPLAGVPVQVVVRGWPRGVREAAELVDVVVGLCGPVVAVVAAPGPLPASTMNGGERIAWSLLTECGATVLVTHEGDLQLRVSAERARLLAAPYLVRWEGGERLPLLPAPGWVPEREGARGLAATAVALAAHVPGHRPERWPAVQVTDAPGPHPAGPPDLLVVARVLEALRTSAREERLVPVT